MTAESGVYRQERREIAQGDRVQFTRGDAGVGIRKGELGTVTSIGATNNLDVQLDKGSVVQLTSEQARHIEHGYAVESTHEAAPNEREIASLSRNGREVNLYTSDGSVATKPETQSQTALPQHLQFEAPAAAIAPQPPQPALRIRMGR